MPRTLSLTLAFLGLTLLATASLSWVTYHNVRRAMETEFARRLESIAATGASQVSPEDIADARLFGEEGAGYIALQVLIEQLRATSSAAHVALLDSARTLIYDTRGADRAGLTTPLDTLARGALDRAYGGRLAVSDPYPGAPGTLRAGLAPVLREGRVAAVMVVEALPDYGLDLAALGRSLLFTTLLVGLVLATLGAVIFRMAWSAVRLERRLSRAENLATMGRLTATLAHEIKNPLAIIRGSAQRLGKLEPEAQRMATNVVEESDRLSRTVARYLHFARPEAGGERRGDAVAALETTLGLLEGEFEARRVTVLRMAGAPATAPVRLDAESLRQVYLNLLLNAVEAMPEGGRLEVGVSESRDKFEVAIADTGPGIPPETLRQLGQPFSTTKAQGSGLGLFLTRRLIESAGGALRIESELGKGTRCRVRLPRSRSASP